MKALRLIAVGDEYDNSLGLMIKGSARFDNFMADRDGSLIAHDLLEHQNGIKWMGPVWDELEALGGIWYVRGQWGDMQTKSNIYSPAENVASDISHMFADYKDGQESDGPGGLRPGSRQSDYDEDFNDIIRLARTLIFREYANDWCAEWDEVLAHYLKLALHRMRAGFRKAHKRFEGKGQSRFNANSLYSEIKQAVAAIIGTIDYEGQEFILCYGGKNSAMCRQVVEEY